MLIKSIAAALFDLEVELDNEYEGGNCSCDGLDDTCWCRRFNWAGHRAKIASLRSQIGHLTRALEAEVAYETAEETRWQTYEAIELAA